LSNHVLDQRGLAGAGLADDVDVAEAIGLFDPEHAPIRAGVGPPQDQDLLMALHPNRLERRPLLRQGRGYSYGNMVCPRTGHGSR
jgi:hypothetical protein